MTERPGREPGLSVSGGTTIAFGTEDGVEAIEIAERELPDAILPEVSWSVSEPSSLRAPCGGF